MTANIVKLYIYDLSNGLARQLSRQLTGKQIDGIWHTSVVVFGREIFYGQGIHTTSPGMSHHGTPLKIIDMGETSLDQETFNEYLAEIRQHYTAEKYHLLEFNCNSFANDCIGFLTGGSIPSYIQDLPADFLSTPFGAALRPTIDSMFRRSTSSSPASLHEETLRPQSANAIARSTASGGSISDLSTLTTPETSSLSAPIHICTNPSSLRSLLNTHRAVVAFFTGAGCGACQMIQPIFDDLANDNSANDDLVFTMIDLGVGLGTQVADEWSVRAVPTFLFFFDGRLIHELKGPNISELQAQVNLLIYDLYPPHPHTRLVFPAMESFSTHPILFTQVPALDTVLEKLVSFINAIEDAPQVKEVLTEVIFPYLKVRFSGVISSSSTSATPELLNKWSLITSTLVDILPVSSLFPLVDMWRLAILDPAVAIFLSDTTNIPDPISILLDKASSILSQASLNSPNYIVTLLRLLSNGFSSPQSTQRIAEDTRESLTALLIPTLLCKDSGVRKAAASLAFNLSAWVQKKRGEPVIIGSNSQIGGGGQIDGDWEVEIVTALVEAIDRENENEDIIHRLTASLAFLLRLSPFYQTQLCPLLNVLQARAILKSKQHVIHRNEVRKLVEEVSEKLCP